jgi:nucleoside-triphosphatase THEP1
MSARCLALLAEPRAGKTETLRALATRLRAAGLAFTGIAQPAVVAGGRVAGYDLEDLVTGERHPFATRGPAGAVPGFVFDPEGWRWAAERILRPAPVLLVDELGLLEAEGRGHAPAVVRARAAPGLRGAVLAVRRECLPALAKLLGPIDPFPLAVSERRDAVVATLCSTLVEVMP